MGEEEASVLKAPGVRGHLRSVRSDSKDQEKFEESSQGNRGMIGTCPAMQQVFKLIDKLSSSDVPVLITGATGTGKEMVARAIHMGSLRAGNPFSAVNCGAIPGELLESELFGHEKGAFTGAIHTVKGKVELADRGTLFLDEVGDLPLELQVKLLRFLQEYSFERVGGREIKRVDLRVISATNSDLNELVTAGRFREDLYFRLNVVHIALPGLKDRGEDLQILAAIFLRRCAASTGRTISGFTKEAKLAIREYPWPGNIRELINHIRRAVVMAEGPWITPEDLDLAPNIFQTQARPGFDPALRLGLKEALEKFEVNLITEALVQAKGNVRLAARTLKTARSVIYHLIKKYDLKEYLSATCLGISLSFVIFYFFQS
jgi:two-component system NtrC family response regulator